MAPSDLKPVYLVTGSDRPKIARALRRLRDRFGEDALEHLTAFETSGEDVVAACNAMGLFAGDGRLVIVDEVERWKAADAKAVAEYLSAPSPETVLVLVGEELKPDSALGKACAKAGQVLVFDVAKHKLPEWVAEQFKLAGAQADSAACRTLVELVGEDLDELSSEVQKLTSWAAGEPIGARDVEAPRGRPRRDDHLRADRRVGRRDPAAALAAAESLLERTTTRTASRRSSRATSGALPSASAGSRRASPRGTRPRRCAGAPTTSRSSTPRRATSARTSCAT